MNTNSNIYTIIYTTVVCVLVAAILAFASQSLKERQENNEKAETISQILTAAQFGDKSEWAAKSNDEILAFYKENVEFAGTLDKEGKDIEGGELAIGNATIYTVSDLKAENYNIRDNADVALPYYKFKNGTTVFAVYGAGLWGPVWGYIAFEEDLKTIKGAYFDHEGETPGLGGKIKDDPSFRAQFSGKTVDFTDEKPFGIIKGGANGKANAIDAISGATMTSRGVEAAINSWIGAYKPVLEAYAGCSGNCEGCGGCCLEEGVCAGSECCAEEGCCKEGGCCEGGCCNECNEN